MPGSLFHYTDQDGYNAIRAGAVWHFKASQPPGNHPFGSFEFADSGDLTPLPGARGQYIFHSPTDYDVDVPRQIKEGPV